MLINKRTGDRNETLRISKNLQLIARRCSRGDVSILSSLVILVRATIEGFGDPRILFIHYGLSINKASLFHCSLQKPSLQLSPANVSFDGTQWAEDATLEAHIVEDRKERRKWTPTEDMVLISAWLNTSKDPVVSNEQKAIAFWKRIAAYVAASPKLAGMQKREPTHCKQRWGKINEGVCKFVGCYEAATKEKSSGQNDSDVIKMAHAIFFNDYKVKFTLEHAWLELRHEQKWCGASTTKDKLIKVMSCCIS
ncbi:hypothetical protein Bca4012_031815 [Brassica carinata]